LGLERTERLSVGISNRCDIPDFAENNKPGFPELMYLIIQEKPFSPNFTGNITKSCYTAAVLYCLNFKEVPEQSWDVVGQQQDQRCGTLMKCL
jgi:hypothetical protein